jgi:hypothetical protein
MKTSDLMGEIAANATYPGDNGILSKEEIASLHEQVTAQLATTNGDAGDCTVSARQLAILLDNYVNER